jgi:hypothetical protein
MQCCFRHCGTDETFNKSRGMMALAMSRLAVN